MVNPTIRTMAGSDWPEVRKIYQEGIQTGLATLETTVPDWESWNSDHLAQPRLVATIEDRPVAWIALSPVSGRCVYGGVAEVSIYVSEMARGRGVGKMLLTEAIRESEADGLWTLQAGILEGNIASIRLHESCGFRVVGVREKLGKLNGRWMNIVLMERRSPVVGRKDDETNVAKT